MKTLRIAQAALATILAVGINSTTYAFMATSVDQPAEVQMNLTEMVDSLRNEIAVGETKCEDMLAKLDAALESIDAKLDQGVVNEEEYLTARDAVSKMRLDLECVANQMAGITVDPGMTLGPVDSYAPSVMTGASCGGGSCGGSSCSTGDCGGYSGGKGGLRVLAPLAIAAAIAIPIANDDDDPGFGASPAN